MRQTRVDQWLVLSAIPSPVKRNLIKRSFVLRESALAPALGDRVGKLVWTAVEAADGLLDFLALKPAVREYCAAYTCVYVHVGRACSARLVFGADDGLAVWLNGKLLLSNELERACRLGDETADVRLKAGWNRLVCKVTQFLGRWDLCAAVECSQAVTVALSPLPAAVAHFLPASSAVEFGISDDSVTVDTLVYNAGRAAKGAKARLLDTSGKPVAEITADVPAGRLAHVKVLMQARALARALSGGDLILEFGDVRIPVGGAENTVRFAALVGDSRDVTVRELRRLLLFGQPSGGSLLDSARAYLSAWGNSDHGRAGEALERLSESAAANMPDRSGETVSVVGHAHIDMNWLWTWPETVQTCHDTFRQVIAFMDEFPDVTFLQSQPSTYRIVERVDPPLFERIKQRVAEGRWELVGGMMTEGDTNMSGGEALARTFLLGQRYFADTFGTTACVGWLPDNFGHVAQLPQILRLAGCEFFYFHRCQPFVGTFWWEAPDGSRVFAYSNRNYNGRVSPDVLRELTEIVPDTGHLLEVCGVGDHGGGPTRDDIEAAHELDGMRRFPAVKFSTAESFLRATHAAHPDRPVHRGEMQYIFEGCYTSIARVKEGNRRCEAALETAELLAVLRSQAGDAYPKPELAEAWDTVTFNQFHDILCGSAIHESNDDAAGRYARALGQARDICERSLRRLADEVRVDDVKGQPVLVFNPSPRPRTALVEAEVFSHARPLTASIESWGSGYNSPTAVQPVNAQVPSVYLRDSAGGEVSAQVVSGKLFPPGWRWRMRFVAQLPACGYATFYVDPKRAGADAAAIPEKNGVFESEFFTVAFDMERGAVSRLYDKRTKRELVRRGRRLNALRVYLEEPRGMSAWNIGPTPRVEDVAVESVRIVERGPVRACVEAVSRWGRSKFVMRTYVYRSYPRVDFELEAHWFEQGDPQQPSPMLRTVFPLAFDKPRFTCHTPFAAVERPSDGREVPAQRWVEVSDGSAGVALLNTTKYGHSLDGGELRLTLLRSSYDPDIYPDQGLHRIGYALYPTGGDWRRGVWDEADAYNLPPLAVEPPSRALGQAHAARPETASFMAVAPAGVILSAVKEAEAGGETIVRLAETWGRAVEAIVDLPAPVVSARRLDILERPIGGVAEPSMDGRRVRVSVRAHEIVTLGLRLARG